MRIGIVIAIERELKAFLEQGSEITTVTVGRREAYHTQMGKHEIYAVCSGWGEIDAASATQFLITAFDCELIMNFGVAGALRTGLAVKDLFAVSGAVNYDFDTSQIDPVAPHQYAEYADERIPLDAELVALAKSIRPDIRETVVASGERFVEEPARVAERNGVKAFSVKCISDTYEGDGGDFQKNVTAGAKKAFELLSELLLHI